MGKVKLTREQAEAIERFGRDPKYEVVHQHVITGWQFEENKCLNELSLDEIIKALYIGYEVEKTFEVGDWLYVKSNGIFIQIDDESQVKGINKIRNHYRHATPEEIAKEKQRRWWARHGRGVWELRRHDLISDKDGCSYTVNLIKEDYVEFVEFGMRKKTKEVKESFKVICFAEDRKDI